MMPLLRGAEDFKSFLKDGRKRSWSDVQWFGHG